MKNGLAANGWVAEACKATPTFLSGAQIIELSTLLSLEISKASQNLRLLAFSKKKQYPVLNDRNEFLNKLNFLQLFTKFK